MRRASVVIASLLAVSLLWAGCGATARSASGCPERPRCLTPRECSVDAHGCEVCRCAAPGYAPPERDRAVGPVAP